MYLLKPVFCLGALLHFTSASPFPSWEPWQGKQCVSDSQASDIVATIEAIFQCADVDLISKALTPNFHHFSYSTLRTQPDQIVPSNVVASSRDEFTAQQVATHIYPCTAPPFVTQKIWHGCDSVSFYWTYGLTDPSTGHEYVFTGIDVLDVVIDANGDWMVSADYSEFSF